MSNYSNCLLEKHGKDFKFKPDFENGIVFDYLQFPKDDHTTRLKVVSPRKRPREASLDLYSWHGSFGAVHYYAKIRLGYPSYVHASNGKPWAYMVTGYDLPFGVRAVEFEVMRLVDKRDLAHDKEQARLNNSPIYGRMKKGEWTHGFWTEGEAKAAAIKFFTEHFEPGWVLVAHSWEEDERPTYATS